MRRAVTLTALVLACAAPGALAADGDRFALANDCWTLRARSAPVIDGPFFLKPTALGSYMFYDRNRAFLRATRAAG